MRQRPALGSATMGTVLHGLLHQLPQAFSERIHLLALELQRARNAFIVIAGLVLAASVLLGTAWIALWIGFAFALVEAGMSRTGVSALILLINVGAATLALIYARSLITFVALPATTRQLTASADGGAASSLLGREAP
jgi:hypothetical protein